MSQNKSELSLKWGLHSLLTALHEAYPTDGPKHHVVLADDDERLMVGIWVGEGCQTILFTEDEFYRPTDELIAEIDYLLAIVVGFPA